MNRPPLSPRRAISLDNYARADILRAFKDRQMPQFSTTCEVDITRLKQVCDVRGASFFVAISYAVSRAINSVPALRQRIIDGVLYEYDRTDPGFTVARENDLFSFCDAFYDEDFTRYRDLAVAEMEAVKSAPDLSVIEKHHMFFITSIPWFSFTAFTHPYDPVYAYVPVITLGKFLEREGRVRMPVAIQVHHGTVDGVHVGRFYAALQQTSEEADAWLV